MLTALLLKLTRHEDLTSDEAASAMDLVMSGQATSAQLAALLVGLSMKGERPEEIVGLAQTMRRHAVRLSRSFPEAFDTCGTGGDRAGTVNISSAAALVMAACGVTIAKHGNRSVSSRCGSADVLEALGVTIAAGPEIVERSLVETGIAFLFAPSFHPSMKHAAATRRELGLRTSFNLLGPLTNPVGPLRQIAGVPRPELTELLARALLMLGSERVWVVHGADGLDEISTTGYTKISEGRDGTVRTFHVHPSDFGLRRVPLTALAGGTADDNAASLLRLLDGEAGPIRDIVTLNAGAGLFVAGRAASVREGIAQAVAVLEDGRARTVLTRLVSITAQAGAAPGV